MAEAGREKDGPAAGEQVAGQQPLFYKQVAALSKERHGQWYIDPEPGYRFAAEANCVYVAGVEFANACHEYPIVFANTGGDTVVPVALLGLRAGQNLFLDEDGSWLGRYVPAYVRRYPFILASDGSGQNFTVCIDEAYSGFNTAQEGERLIDDNGEQGPLLKRSVEFLRNYQGHAQITSRFCARVVELGLLEPVQANISMNSGEKMSLAGFSCVNKQRLQGLDGAVLQELARQNFLDLVYAHLLSLGNLSALLDRYPKS